MNSVRDSYNKITEQWDDFRKKTQINPCIVDFAGLLKPNARILDIGCGTGYPISKYLDDKGFSVTGIDISEKMIEKAMELKLNHATFLTTDFLDFAPTEAYDAVIAFDSIWHIRHSAQEGIYKKIASLLHCGGYLLFSHGRTDGEVTGTMFGETFYYSALDAERVHSLLKENGFRVISSFKDYNEAITGHREWLVIAEKVSPSRFAG